MSTISQGLYTLAKQGRNIVATSTSTAQDCVVEPDHPKWEKLQQYLDKGKLLSISAKGTWSGRKDYEGHYNTKQTSQASQAKQTSQPVEVKLTKLNDLHFSDDLFKPMQTGTVADKFISSDGGFMPGSNLMIAGSAGIGKTSLLCEMLYRVKKQDPKRRVLFISAEMTQLDMARYLKRFPHWGELPILFMGDYTEQNPKAVIESVLDQGWDLVLTDSFSEVNDTVKEACSLTRGKTEKWFLDLMVDQNKGKNKLNKHTCFLTILQLSKGGNYVGSSKLKFMTTAMLHLDWKGQENGSERYMEFSKNRLGQVGQKLYFSLDNGVEFEEQRYQRDLLNESMIQEEKEKLKTEEDAFDQLFGSLADDAED
jgi:predicted ATP-dependent serine protease